MTLQEIVTAVQGAFGSRFQNSTTLVLQYLNTIQQIAFNRDLDAFLVWDRYLITHTELTLNQAMGSLTSASVGVAATPSGASGYLYSFNRSENSITIGNVLGTFAAGDTVVSVPAGSFSYAIKRVGVSRGPYYWWNVNDNPLDPQVRKVLGITKVTDAQIFQDPDVSSLTDYGMSVNDYDERKMFVPGRLKVFDRTFTFASEPDDTANTYRWVYYRQPPTIGLVTDDANLLIPAEFHQTVMVEGAGLLADRSTYGDKSPEQVIAQVLQPFWDAMAQTYSRNGANNNFTSDGQL